MTELELRAKDFATRHHAAVGHKRKYTGEDYINHPVSVAEIVRSVPHTEAMLCAALLHDVVEDTKATLDDVERLFGHEVACLVEMLTDVSTTAGNRAVRKAIDRAHTAKASADAKTIKLADLIDNSRSIIKHDAKFAKVYLAETMLLLDVLRGGDATLWNMANEIVKRYFNEQEQNHGKVTKAHTRPEKD